MTGGARHRLNRPGLQRWKTALIDDSFKTSYVAGIVFTACLAVETDFHFSQYSRTKDIRRRRPRQPKAGRRIF
jgi:hypothetical protein